LADWPIIQALIRAADRGVNVRIYLDGTQLAERDPSKVFVDLAHTPGVEIRTKRGKGAPMHLKSYEIDGHLLRTGAANFSASGLKRQDNDLVVIESAEAAAAFKRSFVLSAMIGGLAPSPANSASLTYTGNGDAWSNPNVVRVSITALSGYVLLRAWFGSDISKPPDIAVVITPSMSCRAEGVPIEVIR
jgi:PLD-like domain